ncbi:alpha/beta fold hydrolase [Pseudomonas sp. IT-P218]|uniref:alpha/beta fold hydrolase n=1 Tax=Pseudomonas sp. IT-P218 TaxID=3026449 RepID=UPI0039E171F6
MNSSPFGDRRVDHGTYSQRVFEVDGTQTVVYQNGTGEPLVYFHGAGTWHGIGFAEKWDEHFKTFLPHHPGFGGSAVNPEIGSMQSYVDHYAKLFDLLGLDRVHLVGTSLGGYLAAEFAARHGERVRRLVLACPAGFDVEDHPQTDLSQVSPELIPDYLMQNVGNLKPYLPTEPDEEFHAMRRKEGNSTSRLLLNGKLINPAMPSVLQHIKSPTLVIWGNNDKILPVGQAEHWQRALPQSELLIVENAGHLVLDESESARRMVREFLLRG